MDQLQSAIFSVIVMISLIPGGFADPLLSMDNSFAETWNNGNIALPGPWAITIPKGPGILTITLVQEPFWKAGTLSGPEQVKYQNQGNENEKSSMGTFLGTTYYQKEAIIGTKQGISDGLPLTSVSRYFSDNNRDMISTVQILPTIVVNTNHQLANRVRYSASWEPLEEGRATNPGCDITGTWKTNWGNISLSERYISSTQSIKIKGSYLKKNQGTFEGVLSGPVLTGEWTEPDAKSGEDSGRFTFFMKDSCSVFTGTWGTGDSDSNGGDWSGLRY